MNPVLIQVIEIQKTAKSLPKGDTSGLETLISHTRRILPTDNHYWSLVHSGLDHTERFSHSKKEYSSNLETFLSNLAEIIEYLKKENQ